MNPTRSFARSFWIAFFPLAAMALVWLHVIWIANFNKLPPADALPVWGKSYVALYDFGVEHGNIDYYLFTTGILGFRERIARADLLLFGSSHVQFGLSAAQLSRELSVAEGHPVKVFNAAMAGSSLDPISDLLKVNNLHGQTAVFDLFALNPPDQSSPSYMLRAFNTSDLEAYLQVGKCWSEFWHDRFLDDLLPNVRMGNPLRHSRMFFLKRFLKFTAIRDWQTGDAISLWTPRDGAIYPQYILYGESPINPKFHPYAAFPNGYVGRHLPTDILQSRHIRPIYTLIPFSGYETGTVPADARPFIPISTDGLYFWDGSHLTARGRAAATENFYEGLEKQGIRVGSPSP